jgi:hypothetical protein
MINKNKAMSSAMDVLELPGQLNVTGPLMKYITVAAVLMAMECTLIFHFRLMIAATVVLLMDIMHKII